MTVGRGRVAAVAACALACAVALRAQQGAFTETTTERGLRIWSFPDDGGDRFVLAVVVGTGARDETPRQRGAAHLLQHLLVGRQPAWALPAGEGRAPVSAAQPDDIGVDGAVTHESTVYWLVTPAGEWRRGIAALAERLLRPTFGQGDLEGERQVVRAELASRDPHAGPAGYARRLYPGHALGAAVAGDAAALDALDRATLLHFHAVHYRAANMAVGFAGRVPRDECADALRAAFAAAPAAGAPPDGAPARPRAGDFVDEQFDDGQLVIGFHLAVDGPRQLALAHLAGACLHRRFDEEVRQRRSLALAPEVAVTAGRDVCRLDFRAVAPGALGDVLAVADDLVAGLRQVDGDLFTQVQASLAGLFEASNGPQLAAAMQLAWLTRRRGMSPGELQIALADLDRADLAAFAAEQLVPRHRYIVAAVPIGRPISLVAGVAVLAVLLLLLDAFQAFARTRKVGQGVVALGRRMVPRRTAVVAGAAGDVGEVGEVGEGAAAARPLADQPIVPVPGDEIEKSIQRWFEAEEGRR